MIRISEMVLPGHPDKFCDQIADAIVQQAKLVDPYAYCQVEVGVWYRHIWLSGGLVTRRQLPLTLEEIVMRTGRAIGYANGNFINMQDYQITSTVCQQVAEARQWTSKVNDQCIAIGYAGYDELTRYLPPEHYLAHALRLALTDSCGRGILKGQGPDGKLMVRMREEPNGWIVEHILVTLQQKEQIEFLEFCSLVERTVESAYTRVKEIDHRWRRSWRDITLLVNPNGPLVNGGSDGDNGQTGRKLVMDFYGPRIPIGGGALSGKDPSHIDRATSYRAREAAVLAVQSGAKDCMIRLAYAPNDPRPLDIDYCMTGIGKRQNRSFFHHDAICNAYRSVVIDEEMAQGGHFFDTRYPWNRLGNQER